MRIRFFFLFTIYALLFVQASAISQKYVPTYDIGIEGGAIADMGQRDAYSGSSFNVSGAYFLNDRLGVRSGFSLLTGIDGCDKYWKVPLLAAFRFPVWVEDGDDVLHSFENEDWEGNFILGFLLAILPKQFEINAGPSVGYIMPERVEYYNPNTNNLEYSEDIKRRYASSLDLNLRLGFPIGHLKLNVNIGWSYLLTRNFIYQQHGDYFSKTTRPVWSGDIRFGGSYTF